MGAMSLIFMDVEQLQEVFGPVLGLLVSPAVTGGFGMLVAVMLVVVLGAPQLLERAFDAWDWWAGMTWADRWEWIDVRAAEAVDRLGYWLRRGVEWLDTRMWDSERRRP